MQSLILKGAEKHTLFVFTRRTFLTKPMVEREMFVTDTGSWCALRKHTLYL